MPLQNRVTPYGDIVAIQQRGLFTGNRGIIHDPETRTLLGRRWTSQAWIVCTCDFRGRRRQIMAPGHWTELFFLDEATALAAGHRPCFFCRREAAEQFRRAWAAGNGIAQPAAPAMDAVLHRQRVAGRGKRIHPLPRPVADLPDGAMLAGAGTAYLVAGSRLHAWATEGYRAVDALPPLDGLLTPPSTLCALDAGYRPRLHPSAAA